MMQFKTIIFSILLFLLLGLSACECNYEGRHVKEVVESDDGLTLITNEGEIKLTALSDNSIQVEYMLEGIKQTPSYAVIPNMSHVQTTINETRSELVFSTKEMRVEIGKYPLTIAYYKGDSLLFSEEKGLLYNDSIKGFRMNLQAHEKLMGAGERVLGMDRRGYRLRLYNQASYGYGTHAELMYYSLPLVVSSRKYMLLFDNVADGWLDMGKTEKDILQFEALGGRMSYVVVAGDSYQSLPEHYTQITGRQPMPPRWVLGNISSRMGYKSQKEVEEVVREYKKQDFPLDAIVLDLYWFGPDLKGHMGNLEWDKKAFPQPELMMKRNKDKGVKTILITEPFVLKNSAKFEECAAQNLLGTDSVGQPYIYDFYFGTTALLDIFKPATKYWFWNIYKNYTLSGVDGWWGDLGEPEVHPADLQHVNGSAELVHNAYGHEWAKTVFEGFKKDFSNRRPVILMRSGFAGSQRYGMIPWSGDVSRSWDGLKPQVEIALQMGMQGLAYMHSDLGGFAGDYKDAELYTRWLQYGVFQPIFRTHAQLDVPPEPIYWDEQTKNIVRRFIKLRYALTPYLYTLVYQNSTKGTPLMQPLFYANEDTSLIANAKSYLWGQDMLVSPVTEKGATWWQVTLPKGANWYHFFTGQKYKGGGEVRVPVTLNEIPVFVKGGSFVPMVKPVENMEAYNTKNLALHYYYDASVTASTGFMYEDDGKTNESWKNNQFEKLYFKSENNKQGLMLSVLRESYNYEGKPESRAINLVVHHIKNKPKSVRINDQVALFNYDSDKQELSVSVQMKTDYLGVLIKLNN